MGSRLRRLRVGPGCHAGQRPDGWRRTRRGAVVATACLFRSASFAAEGAHQLGRPADVRRWTRLAERTRDAFNHHYLEIDGRIRSDADTVYALAIRFGLCVG